MTCRDCIHWFTCDFSGGEIYADEQAIRDDCSHFMRASNTVEVRHGTWYHGTENGAVYAKCSACGRKMNYSCYGYAYCSLCGAKMDGERSKANE